MKDSILYGFIAGLVGSVALMGVVDKLARFKASDYEEQSKMFRLGQQDALLAGAESMASKG